MPRRLRVIGLEAGVAEGSAAGAGDGNSERSAGVSGSGLIGPVAEVPVTVATD